MENETNETEIELNLKELGKETENKTKEKLLSDIKEALNKNDDLLLIMVCENENGNINFQYLQNHIQNGLIYFTIERLKIILGKSLKDFMNNKKK